MPAPTLPVGFRAFHADAFVNYQLNRAHSLGYLPAGVVEAGAAAIRVHADVPGVFAGLADAAEQGGRLAEAASCARLAEFFAPRPSEEQVAAYRRFRSLWDRAFAEDGVVRHEVPFEGGALPALTLAARGERRGTVLLFGGFDSVIEEFFAIWRSVAEAGFDVVAFDGPGQGGARALGGVLHTHDWERPVAAVLDHFGLSEATLVGLSMGGYWAIRAAAREPRVTRVVAWPPVYDWLARLPWPLPGMVRRMVGWRRFMNASIAWRMRLFPVLRHVVAQALWLQGAVEAVECARWFLGMNAEHLGSERVRGPVLLLSGEADAYQPPALARLQARALTGASVSERVFTRAEHAAEHCQMGNLGLANAVLARWLVTGRADP